MKPKFKVPEWIEEFRVRDGPWRSDTGERCGFFIIPHEPSASILKVISAGDETVNGWEHVSVSLADRCPIWEEMKFVKSLFFPADAWVIQFMPPEGDNINVHNHCLHMWRLLGDRFPKPPRQCV